MAAVDDILLSACTNGFSCVDDEHGLLVIIAQVLDDWVVAGGGGGAGGGGAGLIGAGDPEGVVTADPGTTYYATGTATFWVKETGTGNTGWVQLI